MKFLLVLSVIYSQPAYTQQICFNLREVMQDERMGKSTICKVENICLYTDDRGWYNHIRPVPCRKYRIIKRLAKEQDIQEKIIY